MAGAIGVIVYCALPRADPAWYTYFSARAGTVTSRGRSLLLRPPLPGARRLRWLVRCLDGPAFLPFPDFLRPGRLSGAEVRDRRGTADALYPDVLDPSDVGRKVVGGDNHLRGEGLIVPVPGPVKVCQEHDCVLIGDRRLQGLSHCPGALEGRARQQSGRVPANPLAAQAPGQRALPDVASAPETAGRLDEASRGIVRAAARERCGAGP